MELPPLLRRAVDRALDGTTLTDLAAAANAAQQAADLSLQLYNAGLRDFRDVLDAQRSLLTLQDSLASSDTTVSSDLVRLFKALGGGWSAPEMLPEHVASAP